MTTPETPSVGRVRRRLLAVGLRRRPFCPEVRRLRHELERARREYRPPRARLAIPSAAKPKPRVSLEEARRMAAEWVAMQQAPDRPEDPDA
ncbi:hypothetical protein [Nocardiopsis valliformis]|uniref:hypothetical protein n=1 Tax=Nocardiopsis valliformis TaxID=239974 RepID=UPI0003455B92|nr:hypothetical protein [Nocardiopsis valliformis]